MYSKPSAYKILALLFFAATTLAFEPALANDGNLEKSIVRLYSTTQSYSQYRPWRKKNPVRRAATAIYISRNRFITTADIIANTTYLELQKKGDSTKIPAKVLYVDYGTNLALLQADHASFSRGLKPLLIGRRFLPPKTKVRIAKLNNRRRVIQSEGVVFDSSESDYPYTDNALVSYKISANIVNGGWAEAVLDKERDVLHAINMYYYEKKSLAYSIPSPYIRAFLQAFRKNKKGLPFSGIGYYPLTNPVMRKFLKVNNQKGGVYIRSVLADTSAFGAIEPGDILLEINGHKIDFDGNYNHEVLGTSSLENLFIFDGSAPILVGTRVKCKIVRAGKEKIVQFRLKSYPLSKMRIMMATPDVRPQYMIVGGYVFVELSLPYLKEWGSGWRKNASTHLVFFNDYLSYFDHGATTDIQAINEISGRRRIVILSHVLADDSTIGLEWLRDRVLFDSGGKRIESIAQLKKSLQTTNGQFLTFKLSGNLEIAIERDKLPEIQKRIKGIHRIPSLEYVIE